MRRVTMKHKVLSAVLVAALGVLGTPVFSEEVPQVVPGSRVRVHADCGGGLFIGTVEATTDQTLKLRLDGRADGPGSRVLVPLAHIRTLEVSRGRQSNAGRGAATGALVGGLPMVLLSILSFSGPHSCDGFDAPPCWLGPAYIVTVGAGVGALVGLVVGSATTGDRWQTVSDSRGRASVFVTPAPRLGWKAGVSFSF
jgi:hypothetical protein